MPKQDALEPGRVFLRPSVHSVMTTLHEYRQPSFIFEQAINFVPKQNFPNQLKPTINALNFNSIFMCLGIISFVTLRKF
jgi:hypothetical protein